MTISHEIHRCTNCQLAELVRTKLDELRHVDHTWQKSIPRATGITEHCYDSQSPDPFCQKYLNELRWVHAAHFTPGAAKIIEDTPSPLADDNNGQRALGTVLPGNPEGYAVWLKMHEDAWIRQQKAMGVFGDPIGSAEVGDFVMAYLAHPVQGSTTNVVLAKEWLKLCNQVSPMVVVIAPWIAEFDPTVDFDPDRRQRMIARCQRVVTRCDEIWLLGGKVTPGMAAERDAAIAAGVVVRDFTHLGSDPDPENILKIRRRLVNETHEGTEVSQ